jgi:hypothetical protein
MLSSSADPTRLRLRILYVVEPGFYGSPLLVTDPKMLGEKERKAAEKRLALLVQQIRKRGVECNTLVRFGVAYAEIVATAKRMKAGLITVTGALHDHHAPARRNLHTSQFRVARAVLLSAF